jgi:Type II secretion system (T2SS), protein K
MDERGFALMAVLWVLAGVAALALVARVAGRDAVRAALNREDLAVGAWRAEDCVARVRAAASEALRGVDGLPAHDPWPRLDSIAAASLLLAGSGCEVEVRASGAGLDVNAADAETLRRFVAALGAGGAAADSLVDALADWRDPDGEPRPLGAEAAWYRAAGLRPPRDGALADARELARVRGFGRFAGLDTLVALEGGRVPLSRAPAAVLAALPGMTPEAAALVVALRARGEPVAEPAALEPHLSQGARRTLLQGYAELAPLVSAAPELWTVTARGLVGAPPVTAVLEVRLARAGSRAAVVRRRTWSE